MDEELEYGEIVERFGKQYMNINGAFRLNEPLTREEAFAQFDIGLTENRQELFNIVKILSKKPKGNFNDIEFLE